MISMPKEVGSAIWDLCMDYKCICMDEELKGLGKSHVRLGESYEDDPELDELDEQLGESDEDCHRLDELYEQLGESDEFSPSYECVCIRRVARRKLDGWH